MADFLIRVQSIPAFWQGNGDVRSSDGQAAQFRSRMEALWHGMNSLGRPVRFVLGSDGNECHVGFGSSPNVGVSFVSLLQAAFPGVSHEIVETAPVRLRWPNSAVMSGTPLTDATRLPGVADQVIRAMTGRTFLLVEDFSPATPAWLEEALRTIELQRQEIEYERQRMPADSRLHDLSTKLDFNLRRLRLARTTGGWHACVTALAERREDLATVCHLLRAAWSESGQLTGEIVWNQPTLAQTSGFFLPSEIVEIAALPTESHAGFRVTSPGHLRTDAPVDHGPAHNSILLGDVLDGDSSTGASLSYPVERLFEHFGIFGRTGSGKSTALRQVLAQCWGSFRIPFLLIEPGIKREFRGILAESWAQGIRLFPIGEPGCALQFNLLEPQGVPLATHIGHLRALLMAAFAWVTPQQYILSQALMRVYEWFGFDVATGRNHRGTGASMWPTLADLIRVIPSVVAESRYDREIAGNLVAGLTTRLRTLIAGPLGSVLCSQNSVSLSAVLDRPGVVELALLGDDEQKCLLMGAVLLMVAEHRMSFGPATGGHVLVIEEAHRLLRRTSTDQRDDSANSRGQAVDTFASLAAELRTFRQGVGIVEQSPLLLHPEVLANSNLKIAFRLPDAENLGRMAAEFRLDPAQAEHLAFATAGKAAVLGAGMPGAYLVRFPRLQGGVLSTEQAGEHSVNARTELGIDVAEPPAASTRENATALLLLLACVLGESPAAVLNSVVRDVRLEAVMRSIRAELREKGLGAGLCLEVEDRLARAWAKFLVTIREVSWPDCEQSWRELSAAHADWHPAASDSGVDDRRSGWFEARRLAALLTRTRDASVASIASLLPERAREMLRKALTRQS